MRVSLFIFLLVLVADVFASPDIQHWQTQNGARVYYVHAPELPMIDISVTFDAGAARDTDKPGVALMTNGMMPEGAGQWDADAIAERFDSVGASFSNDSKRDMSLFSLRSLTDEAWLQKALDTFAAVITQPTFPKEPLERERKRMLISLQGKKQSPEAITDEKFFHAVYGKHPYASEPEGTEQSIKAITVNDLKAFYKKYFVARNAVIAIVGAVDKKQAAAIAEQVVGKLPAGQPAATLPSVDVLQKANKVRVDFPSSQTHVQLGQPGLRHNDPDYFPLYVGNHILGGSGLVSRVSDEIREKRGLAYSSYSYFIPMREQGPFIMGLQTRNDQADEALKVLREVLRDFIDKGPSEEELTAAKKNITGGFALRVASNSKIVGYLGSIGFYGMSLDYLDTFIDKVNAVTLEQIRDAFQRRLNPDNMVTVMVGGQTQSQVQTAN